MYVRENNYAFIDGQNVHLGTLEDGWVVDFARFRKYLHLKHKVSKAFWFIGFIPTNEKLYKRIQDAGFEIVFKEVAHDENGKPKGNVEAELVLQAMHELPQYDKAILVSGDGDFACLVKYLLVHGKFKIVLSPNKKRLSRLLRKATGGKIYFLSLVRARLTVIQAPKRKGAPGGSTAPRTPFHG